MRTADETDVLLTGAASRFGTPCFVYFCDDIAARATQLKTAFGGRFLLSYAVKANPNPALLTWLASQVDCLDVSSIGELRLALAAGWEAKLAGFTGPGKREHELQEAISAGIGELVLESLHEARQADRIAAAAGRVQDVLVRLGPDTVPRGFGDHMAGRPSPFGFDIEQVGQEFPQLLALKNLRVRGLHIYSGTQCLKPQAICENYRNFIRIFRDVCDRFDLTPERLVFGSGLGIPYHDSDEPLPLQEVAADIAPELDALRAEPRFSRTSLVLELGRYLVGEGGFFVTRVISTKVSRGARIAICDGGMNNHLPASGHFGMVIRRNYRMHKVGAQANVADDAVPVDITGPLCTSIDRLAAGARLPRLEPDDLVAVHNSGAYGLTTSPLHFISHAAPKEVMVKDGALLDVSRAALSLSDLAPGN